MNFKKKKGITLIEIVIAMGVMVIVLATITIAFNTNSNILSKVDMKSELQLDAQMIQEQLSKVALESSGINSLSSENHLILNDSVNDKVTHHFQLSHTNLNYKKVLETDDGNEIKLEKELSKYIENFMIEMTPNQRSMKYTIVLKIKHGKNTEKMTIENQIVFRNSK